MRIKSYWEGHTVALEQPNIITLYYHNVVMRIKYLLDSEKSETIKEKYDGMLKYLDNLPSYEEFGEYHYREFANTDQSLYDCNQHEQNIYELLCTELNAVENINFILLWN